MKIALNTFTKNLSLLILLLACNTHISTYCVRKQDNTKQKRQKSKIKIAAKKVKTVTKICTYTSLGILAAGNGALSGLTLFSFLRNLRQIRKSTISYYSFEITKFLVQRYTSMPKIEKHFIPGLISTLAITTACSFYASYKMLNYAYNAYKKKKPKQEHIAIKEKKQTC